MRLIDADELYDMATKNIPDGGLLYRIPPSLVDKCPTIEAEPVRHGRWKLGCHEHGTSWHCSECDFIVDVQHNFCANCGAKMDLEEGVENET